MTHAKPDAPVLRLTNTLTRSKEEFFPIDAANVRMYVCGPTVYDFAHIGNARPVIVFDVLYRLLRHVYGADHVTYVRNITDVDDKINARALRDHPGLPLNDAIALVTKTTADQFHKDVATLGNLEPTHEPRATQHIAGMVSMIETLIARGHAYVAATEEGGEVLFDTGSMPTYGQLSKRNLDDQLAGARIAVDAHKKNPGDFVLWKLSSPEEPGWDSPWGRGRPGWHIECSVMSKAHLGEVFDIHGGGLDLIFPHHENEIAQSCCAHGTSVMANYWMHNGFVQVEGRKMSKSDGNFFTIHDLLHTEVFGGRKWPGEVLRLFILGTHYRQPLDLTVGGLLLADKLLLKWEKFANMQEGADEDYAVPVEVVDALSDDLNMSLVGKYLDSLVKREATIENRMAMAASLKFLGLGRGNSPIGNALKSFGSNWNRLFKYYSKPKFDDEFERQRFLEIINRLGSKGLDLNRMIETRMTIQVAAESAKAIGDREMMKQKFAEADDIRDQLSLEGVLLKDGKDPTTGQRTTTWEVKR